MSLIIFLSDKQEKRLNMLSAQTGQHQNLYLHEIVDNGLTHFENAYAKTSAFKQSDEKSSTLSILQCDILAEA